MIVKWLLDALSWAIAGLVTGLDAVIPDPPGWVTSGLGQVSELYGHAAEFGAWIPVDLALTILAFVLAIQLAVTGMLLVRMAISYTTFGGGVVSK